MVSPCFQFERGLNFPFDWPASVSNILIVGRNFTSRIRPMTLASTNTFPIYESHAFGVISAEFSITYLYPAFFSNIPRQLRSSTSQQLSIPRTELNLGKRAFSVAAPIIWNELPTTLKSCESLASFRKHLKTYLFKIAFAS